MTNTMVKVNLSLYLIGKLTEKEAGEYDGDWKDDVKVGRGIQSYPNGDVYEGDWENDMRNGNGI